MPSRKTITVLIVCIGVVLSVWLLLKSPTDDALKTDGLAVVSYNNAGSDNEEWKKLLVNVDPSVQNLVASNVNNDSVFDGTTLTAQFSQDLFSRYILAAGNGQTVDTATASKITDEVLSQPAYSKSTAAVYVISNLHISTKKDKVTTNSYNQALKQALQTRLPYRANILDIMVKAQETENDKDLALMDPIIKGYQGLIADLIKMEIPSDSVTVHLAYLNACSNILSDLEGMRQLNIDPARSLVSMSHYIEDAQMLEQATFDINKYFSKKLDI